MSETRQIRHSRARARENRSARTAEKTRVTKAAFIAAFAACGRITLASASVGIDRTTHYVWYGEDEAYRKEFNDVRGKVADMLEDEAIRRAVEGVERPLIGTVGKHQSGVIGYVREYSDRLLELLLKGNRPERYKERREITGTGVRSAQTDNVRRMSDDELDAELKKLEADLAASNRRKESRRTK
jgi:hypothetical protein